jgi:hypothetical protein
MNVVSTCLFDDSRIYQQYLPAALRAHHCIFKGWVYRIYHDQRINEGGYVRALRALVVRGLVEMVEIPGRAMIEKAMLWRLMPLWDDSVERFIMRDVDSIASYRERRVVETWMRSGLAAHAIGDKRGHHDWPMIDGLIGFEVAQARILLDAGPRRNAPDFEAFLARAKWPNFVWDSDRERTRGYRLEKRMQVSAWTTNNLKFLVDYVWPRVQHHTCEHRLSGSAVYDAAMTCREVDPFKGEDLGVPQAVREGSDAFVPFIGASKKYEAMDLDAIVSFYREHGDPEIERAISECEAL